MKKKAFGVSLRERDKKLSPFPELNGHHLKMLKYNWITLLQSSQTRILKVLRGRGDKIFIYVRQKQKNV